MIILFVIGILLGAVSVVFALQNIEVITVSFFSWSLTGSLALILMLAIVSGILITTFLLLPEFISGYFKYKSLRKENERLSEELKKQKELNNPIRNASTENSLTPEQRGAQNIIN